MVPSVPRLPSDIFGVIIEGIDLMTRPPVESVLRLDKDALPAVLGWNRVHRSMRSHAHQSPEREFSVMVISSSSTSRRTSLAVLHVERSYRTQQVTS